MVSAMMIVYHLLFLYVFFPETEKNIMSQMQGELKHNAHAPLYNIDGFVAMTRRFFVPLALLGSFLFTMLCGLIASFIGALCSKYRSGNIFLNTN
jgi:hypothetical protein